MCHLFLQWMRQIFCHVITTIRFCFITYSIEIECLIVRRPHHFVHWAMFCTSQTILITDIKSVNFDYIEIRSKWNFFFFLCQYSLFGGGKKKKRNDATTRSQAAPNSQNNYSAIFETLRWGFNWNFASDSSERLTGLFFIWFLKLIVNRKEEKCTGKWDKRRQHKNYFIHKCDFSLLEYEHLFFCVSLTLSTNNSYNVTI